MKLKVLYKGRAITPRDLDRLSQCFGEKIDDMKLCQAVILRVMQSHNAMARGAMVRALDTGICKPGEGGRDMRRAGGDIEQAAASHRSPPCGTARC